MKNKSFSVEEMTAQICFGKAFIYNIVDMFENANWRGLFGKLQGEAP